MIDGSTQVTPESLDAIETFTRQLRGLPNVTEAGLKDVALTLRNLIQGDTPVGETGTLKKGWSSIMQIAGGYSFENPVPYAFVPEQGRYRGVGPRTVSNDGGIFSRQAPSGMTAPTLQDDGVMDGAVRSVLLAISQALETR